MGEPVAGHVGELLAAHEGDKRLPLELEGEGLAEVALRLLGEGLEIVGEPLEALERMTEDDEWRDDQKGIGEEETCLSKHRADERETRRSVRSLRSSGIRWPRG